MGVTVYPSVKPLTLIFFVSQRRNFTLAFQAAESVGIKCTLVSPCSASCLRALGSVS